MITGLTEEQKSRFPEFVDKWIKIGLSTEPADRPKSEECIKHLYKLAELEEPKIVWAPCPLSGALTASVLFNLKKFSTDLPVRSAVYSAIYSAVDSVVYSAVYSAVDSVVRSAVYSAVYSAVDLAVYSAVYSVVRSAVYSAVDSAVDLAYWGGSLWAAYTAWTDYFSLVLKINIDRTYLDLVQSCGVLYTFRKLVVMTERPELISISNNRLHNEREAALKYRSGWCLYALNGVVVPDWLVLTRSEEINPRDLLKLANAEQRREFVRKVGIDRICYSLKAKCLDNVGNYELLLLDLGDGRKRPYLKMLNPSIGTWHVEGVPPGCDTVEKALNFRKPNAMKSIMIDDAGEDWYQQGDVCIWPKNAKSLKPLPTILT